MENLKEIGSEDLRLVNGGEKCDCSSAVLAVGAMVGEVVDYFDLLAYSIGRIAYI